VTDLLTESGRRVGGEVGGLGRRMKRRVSLGISSEYCGLEK